jgi:hypothetical protein
MHRATLAPVLGVLHAIAACAGAGATRSPVGPAAACLPLAEAQARAAAGAQRNEERYRKALEAKGLAPIALEQKEEISVHENEGAVREGMITRDEGGRQVRYLIGPEGRRACNIDPRGWSLARNASGELYTVERRPKVLQPDYIAACGCRVESGAVCGGAAVNPYAAGLYPIPDGLEYKGSVAIEYDRDAESVLFTSRLPNGKDCPPQEPPP